ncbi:MAG: YdaU family protein [Planctomycetes bacterium]|nr:YdaU family protein [Planctomycetota bacterium]
MSDGPPPPVPATCDLRDFPFYQIDVARLRDSELMAAGDAEVFRCAVLSWCYAWHQLPAGSMPDDDATLARAMGFGRDIKGWKKVRAGGGLRGWTKASDGRLYHPVVTEKVLSAWRRKLAQRWTTECARIKKHNQRNETNLVCPDFESWLSNGCPQGHPLPVPGDTGGVNGSKGQLKGEGEGERENTTPPAAASYSAGAKPPPPSDPLDHEPGPKAIVCHPKRTLADLQAIHPVLVLFRDDRELMTRLLALYEFDRVSAVLAELTPGARARAQGKQRVTVSELQATLQAKFIPDPEDYQRAGLPVPPEAKP